MTATLLDANVLIAAAVRTHVHHDDAATWLGRRTEPFVTCAITQGALLRYLIRTGADSIAAVRALESITASPHHQFWACADGFDASTLRGVVGHRQVTDAYLSQLARSNSGTIATFDAGLAAMHSDVAELLST